MDLSAEQQSRVRKHAEWLNKDMSEYIYNRTIEIAKRYEPKRNADDWLLFLANNIYIAESSIARAAEYY